MKDSTKLLWFNIIFTWDACVMLLHIWHYLLLWGKNLYRATIGIHVQRFFQGLLQALRKCRTVSKPFSGTHKPWQRNCPAWCLLWAISLTLTHITHDTDVPPSVGQHVAHIQNNKDQFFLSFSSCERTIFCLLLPNCHLLPSQAWLPPHVVSTPAELHWVRVLWSLQLNGSDNSYQRFWQAVKMIA